MEGKFVTLTYHKEDTVALITLKSHTVTLGLLREYHDALDKVLKKEGPMCLVTASSHPKIFSAGLNFKVFDQHYMDVANFISESCRLFGRLLALPIPSIAAINGHALAGGFMLIMSHDKRICVSDKKCKFGMTEIDLGMTIPRGMLAPLKAKMKPDDLMKVCLTGMKFGPKEGKEMGVIHKLVPSKDLIEACLEEAERLSVLGENRVAYEGIKFAMWEDQIKLAFSESYDKYAEDALTKVRAKMSGKL